MNFNYIKPGKMYRHNGFLKNNHMEVAVVESNVPEQPEKALVVLIQRLPNVLRDEFNNIVEHEGNTISLGQLSGLLSRRKFQGMSMDAYTTLFRQNYIIAVNKADIVLTPNTATAIPYLELESLTKAQEAPVELTEEEKAVRLVQDAARLEADAAALREQAYAIKPDLRPIERVAPTPRPVVEEAAPVKQEEAPAKEVKAKAPAKAKTAAKPKADATDAPKRGRKPKAS